MGLCAIDRSEESPEVKTIRKKDQEIERLKDVIVEQAKERLEAEWDYKEVLACNTELRDARDQLNDQLNDMCVRLGRSIAETKDLLRLAKECADDTTKSKRQRDVSKIRVECLQDVIDILEGKEEGE